LHSTLLLFLILLLSLDAIYGPGGLARASSWTPCPESSLDHLIGCLDEPHLILVVQEDPAVDPGVVSSPTYGRVQILGQGKRSSQLVKLLLTIVQDGSLRGVEIQIHDFFFFLDFFSRHF
jgi:hypothetical protein